MQRIKLVLEYDGTAYSGWQIQNGQTSIQQLLEQAFFVLFKIPIRVTAAGRTDAGVHARNQVVHCDIPAFDLFRLKRSLNGLMNRDIVVKSVREAPVDFHARFDATARLYRYYLSLDNIAINRSYCWTVHYPLNLTLMQIAAKVLLEYENFQAFCKVKSDVSNHLCDMISSHWFRQNELLVYEIKANRFLHGMVRAIVGTLVELGRSKITLLEFKQMIKSRNRTLVPATAPACGLVLEDVFYK